jgi:hypothetical protein
VDGVVPTYPGSGIKDGRIRNTESIYGTFTGIESISVFLREIRRRSRSETAQFQENFEVYMQTLISQCLDSNFLNEIFSEQGEMETNKDT